LKRKRKVIAFQISESQLSEVERQKPSVLPSDKSTSGVKGERASETLQEEILEPPMESTAQPSLKKQKQTTEVPRKEVYELQGLLLLNILLPNRPPVFGERGRRREKAR
jgi:hypothetical protein